MYKAVGEAPFELTRQRSWWDAINGMNLGSEYRMDLEQLSRRDASDHDPSRGTLSFLLDRGIAQMAIHLLPFIQRMVLKCGELGVIVVFKSIAEVGTASAWSNEHTNIQARQVVARGQTGTPLIFKHFPALPLETGHIVNVTGAGDSLVGSMLSTLLQTPQVFEDPSHLSIVVQHAQSVRSRMYDYLRYD